MLLSVLHESFEKEANNVLHNVHQQIDDLGYV